MDRFGGALIEEFIVPTPEHVNLPEQLVEPLIDHVSEPFIWSRDKADCVVGSTVKIFVGVNGGKFGKYALKYSTLGVGIKKSQYIGKMKLKI